MDFRLAARRIREHAGVSAAVVAALALAMAVNGALFSIVYGLFDPALPFQEPDGLVAVDYRRYGDRIPEVAYLPALSDRRAALRDSVERSPFVSGAAQAGYAFFFPRDEADALGLEVTGVDARFFGLLGLAPVLGVDFSPDDERSEAAASPDASGPLPVILGYELWRRLFGSDPATLGVMDLAGRRVRVVGVMAPGVRFPGDTNVWAPVRATRDRIPAYIRLSTGARLEQVAGQFPELTFTSIPDAMRTEGAGGLVLLFAAAGLLLLVAWVQVASLLFSTALGHLPEIGVRLALGGGRLRVVRLFALEYAALAALAFGLSWAALRPLTSFVVSMLPDDLRRGQYLEPDGRTFLFVCAISLVGFALLLLVPLRVVGSTAALPLLNGRLGERAVSPDRVRRLLLGGQVALTTLLLYLSGLAVHSYVNALRFDYGFDAQHVLLFTPKPWARFTMSQQEAFARFAERNRKVAASVEALRGLPGVTSASTFFAAPLGLGSAQGLTTVVEFDGRPIQVKVRVNSVGRDFVHTLGATVKAGHSFDDVQPDGRESFAVINEALARRLAPSLGGAALERWPSVVGRTIKTRSKFRVIGVIKDLVDSSPALAPDPQLYEEDRRTSAAALVAIRLATSSEAARAAVRTTLEREWGKLTPSQLGLLRDRLDSVLTPYRSQSILLVVIALFCLPITAIGLMGTIAHAVRMRTREIAIRLAIGADSNSIRWTVLRPPMLMSAAGAGLGVLLGMGSGRVVAHQLFGVRALDGWSIVGVAASLLGVAALAGFTTATRASRVQPADALRRVEG